MTRRERVSEDARCVYSDVMSAPADAQAICALMHASALRLIVLRKTQCAARQRAERVRRAMPSVRCPPSSRAPR